VESLDKRIGKLPSEELAKLAGDLEALTRSPGWQALTALLADEAQAAEDGATKVVATILRQGKPFAAPETLYRRVGFADGLKHAPVIVDKVLATWEIVRAQLEREERG
jgi:hypothetical protein